MWRLMFQAFNIKQKGFTLIELLVVVAIIGILAAVGVVAYSGYTASAKANSSRENMTIVYKTWLNEKYLCETKDGNDRALWEKTQCHVLLIRQKINMWVKLQHAGIVIVEILYLTVVLKRHAQMHQIDSKKE